MVNRLLICLMAFAAASLSLFASDVKTVKGESTFYGESSHSLNDCKRFALEQARIAALAKEFGTTISQDVYQRDMVSGNTESNYFSMLNRTEVNGEWIADEGEPVYTVSHDADDNYVVTCVIKGTARRLTNEAVEFEASVLRNGNEKRFADTRFRSGDDMKLYFRAPVAGYLAVYLIDDARNVYSLLPYSNNSDGIIRTSRDKDYIFFDTEKADRAFGEPDEMIMTLEGDVERNHLYVIFSPTMFSRALDNSAAGTAPRTLSYDSFTEWLTKVRKRDPKMAMKVMHLEITK